MFALTPRLWLYVGAVAILIGAVIGVRLHFAADERLKEQLQAVQVENATIKAEKDRIQKMLLDATRSQEEYKAAAEASDAAIEKLRKDAEAKYQKLKNRPVHTDCKDAVDWVRKNKELLK